MSLNLPYTSQSSPFPVGFRFAQFDDEIILHYLAPKIADKQLSFNIIEEVNVYQYDPQTLSEQYTAQGEEKWYFLSTRDKVNKNGGSNKKRTTGDFGFWRITDSPHPINSEGLQIGSKTTLVYFRGKSSDAKKTNWIMHEFEAKSSPDAKVDDIVICRIYERKACSTKKRARVEETVAQPQPMNQIPNNNSDNNYPYAQEESASFMQPHQDLAPYGHISNSSHNMHQQIIYNMVQQPRPLNLAAYTPQSNSSDNNNMHQQIIYNMVQQPRPLNLAAYTPQSNSSDNNNMHQQIIYNMVQQPRPLNLAAYTPQTNSSDNNNMHQQIIYNMVQPRPLDQAAYTPQSNSSDNMHQQIIYDNQIERHPHEHMVQPVIMNQNYVTIKFSR
ncbi:NAC domain-containing protein 55-like [Senna tora]|uniref:NAC domain-containing protein 55-like n=1 Tax=Senna tora TaxID=362788 RepID=A0A834W754_9FABA|nr:NAC domain-containing protein 55-like [Senna tora]